MGANEFLTAIGLMLVIEGACYALFPGGMRDMISRLIALPDQQVRVAGIVSAVFGFLMIAVLRG